MSSTELGPQFHPLLLQLAREAIIYGLENGKEMELHMESMPSSLMEKRASFVTLRLAGNLRGCIGSLEAYRPLVVDVVSNAYAAAFSDPRFNPLTDQELDDLQIGISILSPTEELIFDSEAHLMEQLRPGIDGLILKEGTHRGTFLPSVWESLPEKRQFLDNLKLKAGLTSAYWSSNIQVYRYTTQTIEAESGTT
jgi:AmmeMemoRadiSam system protein A